MPDTPLANGLMQSSLRSLNSDRKSALPPVQSRRLNPPWDGHVARRVNKVVKTTSTDTCTAWFVVRVAPKVVTTCNSAFLCWHPMYATQTTVIPRRKPMCFLLLASSAKEMAYGSIPVLVTAFTTRLVAYTP